MNKTCNDQLLVVLSANISATRCILEPNHVGPHSDSNVTWPNEQISVTTSDKL